MQDKTWYSILGLDAEPLFLQDDMLRHLFTTITKEIFRIKVLKLARSLQILNCEYIVNEEYIVRVGKPPWFLLAILAQYIY